ncbi:MAG: molecular chaperone DnaJ [Patescibacteria group bacterium]|nr:molecular chaperone DnaJ [Patescibacteria group bacterium]
MEDYYKTLGVSKSASKEEIKKAYRKLAHKHHPDKGGDEKTFKKISEAYQVLSNDNKRTQYDQFGKSGPGMGGSYSTGGQRAGFGGFSSADFDFGDIFEEFFGFSGGSRRRKRHRRGEDIRIRIDTKLSRVIKNEEKTINLTRFVSCSSCNGSGDAPDSKKEKCKTCQGQGSVITSIGPFKQKTICPNCQGSGETSSKKCSTCRGEGRVKKEEKITFTIPAGIDSGQTLRIDGKGNAGEKEGECGDLLVDIFVENDTKFKRQGSDLHYTTEIKYTKLALGGKIDIKTVFNKEISVKIPAGTTPETVFRISKKGLPKISGYSNGDLYVKLKVSVPKKINRKQRKILQELEKEEL